MSLDDDRDGQRKRKPGAASSATKERPSSVDPRRKRKGDGVGDALRSAYQRTLREEIPPEMLDLLGKLG